METNGIEGDEGVKKEKKEKIGKFKGAASSYKCQFCDKSFPRLGYLKKHEQVSELNSPPHVVLTAIKFSFIITTTFYEQKLSPFASTAITSQ